MQFIIAYIDEIKEEGIILPIVNEYHTIKLLCFRIVFDPTQYLSFIILNNIGIVFGYSLHV